MKIVVFSDSHGYTAGMERAMSFNSDADLVVFLGDGVADAEEVLENYPSVPFVKVSGNREQYFADFLGGATPDYEAVFVMGGVKFLAMHGHRPANVKHGVEGAAVYAKKKGADVLLYGHTHEADDRVIETGDGGIRVINPGSVGARGDGTYAVLEVMDGNVVCGFGDVR